MLDEFDLDKRLPLEWWRLNTPLPDELLTTPLEYQLVIDAWKAMRSGLVSPGLMVVRSAKRKSEARTWQYRSVHKHAEEGDIFTACKHDLYSLCLAALPGHGLDFPIRVRVGARPASTKESCLRNQLLSARLFV